MHVCMIKGYVCSMSVQGVKHIYAVMSHVYIYVYKQYIHTCNITTTVTTQCFGVLIQIVNQVLCLSDCECTLYFSKRDKRRYRKQAIPQYRGTKI